MTLLVRTPTPHPTESLLGFVLRVAEANGYESPRYIWDLAQVPRGAEMAPRLPVEGLAGILGQSSEHLRRIAYRTTSEGRGSFQILGQPLGDDLRGGPLRLRKPAFCPSCVAEKGYLDAFWDLSIAVACPIHRRSVLRACPVCTSPIIWLRPGLLQCHCGASLTQTCPDTADSQLCDLLALVQARLHGRPIGATAGFPAEHLASMPFSALIRMLIALGAQADRVRGIQGKPDGATVALAVPILANWPHGYHSFLAERGNEALSQNSGAVGLRKQFAGFYEAMFRNRAFSEHVAFLREEFLRFGLDQWGRAAVDPKFFRARHRRGEARFQSKSEVARRFRLWKPTMGRMIANGTLVTQRIGTGRHARTVVDLEKSRLPEESVGIISVRQAASRLGLPVSVIRQLRQAGVFDARLRRGRANAWHLDDVDAFRNRALALPLAKDHHAGDVVRLGDLMRLKLRDARAKADVVAATLDGKLAVRGRVDESPSGLLLDRVQVDAFILSKRCDVERNSYSLPQCAKLTGLDPRAVESAIAMGLLAPQERDGRIRVTASSVGQFQAEYVPLSAVARRLGTVTRRLLRTCRDHGHPVTLVQRTRHSSPQPILNRAAEPRLVELWESVTWSQGENSATGTLSCEERLRRYLDQLRGSGQGLPRRAGRPRRAEIARACGINRSAFYINPSVAQLLTEFDQRESADTPCRDAMEKLRSYLRRLEQNGESLPRWGGRPNKLAIAKAIGIERNVFYWRPEALRLVNAYGEREARHATYAAPRDHRGRERGVASQLQSSAEILFSPAGSSASSIGTASR